MLISTIQNSIKSDYVDCRVTNTYLNEREEEGFNFKRGHNFVDEKKTSENEIVRSELFYEYRKSLLKSVNGCIYQESIAENGGVKNSHRVGTGTESREIALDLERDSNEENRCYQMNSHKESLKNSCNASIESNNCVPVADTQENSVLENDGVFHSSKMNSVSHLGYPTTSKSVSKMQMSADEETNFDIFDYHMGSDDDFANGGRPFEKDALAINGDLVNKYENGLGLDILKDKNVCWAAGNIENEVCPLRSYGGSNENSLSSFAKENLDSESRDSFSQGWAFDENIEQVSQDQSLIVPKKTVDITRIKGWRKKQFTTDRDSDNKTICAKSEDSKEFETVCKKEIEDNNKDFAFVCDELDDFLDQEAELKINYEIPHLSAECGIKLTSEELVSRPKVVAEIEPINPKRLFKNNRPFKTPAIKTEPEINPPAKNPLPNKPKSKSALPGKSSKTSKEIKGRSLLKQTKEPEVAPSRRSSKVSKSSVPNKSNDISNRSVCVKRDLKVKQSEKTVPVTFNSLNFGPDYKFIIRTFGMVMYPGPNAPLNPFIRYHLQKMRSYRTYIDKYWANFAVSAVAVKGKVEKRRRMILPMTCCFKYKSEDAKTVEKTDKIKEEAQESSSVEKQDANPVQEAVENLLDRVCDDSDPRLMCKESFLDVSGDEILPKDEDLKNFSTEIEADQGGRDQDFPDAGMDDIEMNCVDASELVNVGSMQMMNDSTKDVIFDGKMDSADDLQEVICLDDTANPKLSSNLSQFALNKVITKLLTKKFNELKITKNVNNSIDKLKTFTPNTLELIKLNFIKENFASGYINLWYVKSKTSQRPKRVFLTFSMNPPEEKAINLKMISRSHLVGLPNLVNEIITDGSGFDNNDFAILYCNGQNWEIHGSVNFTVDKSSELPVNEKRQVFNINSMDIPELDLLDKIKRRDERSRILKWWVLHMTQDFSEVNVKYRGESGRVSRSVILKTWRSKVPSFIEFKGLEKVRTLGIAIVPTLWPYFLIGPYFINDDHGLTLKLHGVEVPFEYSLPLDRIKPSYVLKRFITSVVMHSWRSCRQVVGIWLYDRVGTKQSSFIEVRTKVKKSGNYEPSVEHAYSLTRTQEGLTETKFDPLEDWKRTTEESGQKPEPVCLVSNIPKLGYIEGELSKGIVTIPHPLRPDKKIKLRDINKDLNAILKTRLTFIPDNLVVQWKVVKRSAIGHHPPLDRFLLGGTHILCNRGLFYILNLSKDKIMKLGLDEKLVMKAIDENPLIQEIMSMKELGKTLVNSDKCDLSISEILTRALSEIEHLESESNSLETVKTAAENERVELCRKFLSALRKHGVEKERMGPILAYTNRFLKRNRKKTAADPETPSERQNFVYLDSLGNSLRSIVSKPPKPKLEKPVVKKPWVPPMCKRRRKRKRRVGKRASDPAATKNGLETVKKESAKETHEWDSETVRKLESKIDSLYEVLKQTNVGDDLYEEMKERLKAMSEHLKKIKSVCNSAKDAKDSSIPQENVIKTEITEESSQCGDEPSKEVITNGFGGEQKDLQEDIPSVNESIENTSQSRQLKEETSEIRSNGLDFCSNPLEMHNSGGESHNEKDSTIHPGKSLLKNSVNSNSFLPPEKISKIERTSKLKKAKQVFIIRKRKNRDEVNSDCVKKCKDS